MERGTVHSIHRCDTREMTADGHTKGRIDRDMLLQVMGGIPTFKHDAKRHTPYRASRHQVLTPPDECVT
eukprot:9501148-Pyramimonas_sp.AAC.2